MSALMKSVAFGAAAVMGLASLGSAAPVVEVARYQNNLTTPFVGGAYAGTEDTFLNGGATSAKNVNYGGSTAILTTNAGGRIGLLRFDLSSMQGQNATVVSASLFLRPAASYVATISAYSVLPVNGDWVGGSGTSGTATDGSSTWNSKRSYGAAGTISPGLYQPGPNNIPWKDANGNDVVGLGVQTANPTDSSTWGFGPTALASASAIPVSGNTIRLDLPASLVQQWIGGTNYGLVLTSTDAASGVIPSFYSGNQNNTASPLLVINYSVPEPMSASLLLIGGGLLALRRRRTEDQTA